MNENNTGIILSTSSQSESKVSSSDIYDFDNDVALVSLSGCELILFVGCETAAHTKGIVYAAVAAGAECAIGFKEIITCSDANKWTTDFFTNLLSGYNVSTAAEEALSDYGEGHPMRSIKIIPED
jgi:hypothetical protein